MDKPQTTIQLNNTDIGSVRIRRKLQTSKVITFFILFVITVTWLVGLYTYWGKVDLFNYLLDYVERVSLGTLADFCLAACDRLNWTMQAKYQNQNRG